jgi:catechol 2,3-dioxygenase-like lactoylglutathione lyase family enzyme
LPLEIQLTNVAFDSVAQYATNPQWRHRAGANAHRHCAGHEEVMDTAMTQSAVGFVGVIHEGVPCKVRNLQPCIRFYTDVLGLRLLPRPKALDDIGPGAWLSDAQNRVQFHLIAKDDEYSPGPGARLAPAGRHTAWLVRDLDAFRTHLRALGVHYEEVSNLVGAAQLFVQDPEGHTWEFQGAQK